MAPTGGMGPLTAGMGAMLPTAVFTVPRSIPADTAATDRTDITAEAAMAMPAVMHITAAMDTLAVTDTLVITDTLVVTKVVMITDAA